MNKKQIGGLVIAAVLFIIVGASSVLTNTFSERMLRESMDELLTNSSSFNPPSGEYIAVVTVQGTIQEQTETGMFDVPAGYQHITTLDYIDNLMSDSDNKGLCSMWILQAELCMSQRSCILSLRSIRKKQDVPSGIIWLTMRHPADI